MRPMSFTSRPVRLTSACSAKAVSCVHSGTAPHLIVQHARKHNGNEEAALGLILESLSNGGVANYLKLLDCTQAPSSPMKPIADACDRCLSS